MQLQGHRAQLALGVAVDQGEQARAGLTKPTEPRRVTALAQAALAPAHTRAAKTLKESAGLPDLDD